MIALGLKFTNYGDRNYDFMLGKAGERRRISK
jgi:hypothetical protein